MRVMVLVKATERSETGAVPTTEELDSMSAFNEQLVKAGVMLAADGLRDSSLGKRISFGDSGTTVLDGPFAETKELVAGYWIWQVSSMDEALEWAGRAPFPAGSELELRQVFEPADFGDQLTPELKQRGQDIRDEVAARNQ